MEGDAATGVVGGDLAIRLGVSSGRAFALGREERQRRGKISGVLLRAGMRPCQMTGVSKSRTGMWQGIISKGEGPQRCGSFCLRILGVYGLLGRGNLRYTRRLIRGDVRAKDTVLL